MAAPRTATTPPEPTPYRASRASKKTLKRRPRSRTYRAPLWVRQMSPAAKQHQANKIKVAEAKLVAEINEEHRLYTLATESAWTRAWDVGALLVKAKDIVGHGAWDAWVEANLTFTVRQAQKYMRFHRLSDRNANLSSGLSVVASTMTGYLSVMGATKPASVEGRLNANRDETAPAAGGSLPRVPKGTSAPAVTGGQFMPATGHLNLHDETVEVTGEALNGLLVYRGFRAGEKSKWCVLHQASGLRVENGQPFDTRAGAKVFAAAISALADWTQPKEAVMDLGQKVRAIQNDLKSVEDLIEQADLHTQQCHRALLLLGQRQDLFLVLDPRKLNALLAQCRDLTALAEKVLAPPAVVGLKGKTG